MELYLHNNYLFVLTPKAQSFQTFRQILAIEKFILFDYAFDCIFHTISNVHMKKCNENK